MVELGPTYNRLALSLPGWGKSFRPDKETDYTIASYTKHVATAISSLKEKHPSFCTNGFIVFGHSMGGKIAQYLLTIEAIAEDIKTIVLIAPAPPTAFELPEEMQEQQIHAYDNIESAIYVIKNVLLSRPDAINEGPIAKIALDAVGASELAKRAWPKFGMQEDILELVTAGLKMRQDKGLSNHFLAFGGVMDQVEKPDDVLAKTVAPLTEAGAHIHWAITHTGHLSILERPDEIAKEFENWIDGRANQADKT